MFEGNRAALDPRQRMIELSIYLGIGYRELVSSPAWFLEIASIRMKEEGDFAEYQRTKAAKQ